MDDINNLYNLNTISKFWSIIKTTSKVMLVLIFLLNNLRIFSVYGLGARIDMVYLTYVIYVAIFLFEHKVWLAISMSMF